MTRALLASLSLVAMAAASVPHPALAASSPSNLPDQFELGRNGLGDPCQATRNWDDGANADPFATSYSFTCRNAVGNRFLGFVRELKTRDAARLDASLDCGEASTVTIPSIGPARSRRCFDKTLGLETVETRVTRGSTVLSASAYSIAQGPAEEGLRILAGVVSPNGERGRTVTAVVNPSQLAPAPTNSAGATVAVADAEAALEQGLRLVRQGLNLEASRVLNDALSRLPENGSSATRVDLLLLAGLADSNLRFFSSAQQYFARAQDLIAQNPGMPGAGALERKRRNYTALDLLNQRQFSSVAGSLTQAKPETADEPLMAATTVRELNVGNSERGSTGKLLAVADQEALSQFIIESQAGLARSVAALAEDKPIDAAAALTQADTAFRAATSGGVSDRQVLWLSAKIERQRARILLRQGDRPGAEKSLAKAIEDLQQAELNSDGGGPALAQTQFEMAGVLAGGTGPNEAVFSEFDAALTSLVNADSSADRLPFSAEITLNRVVSEPTAQSDPRMKERFFRALQVAADPAIARQFVQLQSLVTADPALASKVKDKQELDREIARLRYEAQANPGDAGKLDAQRGELEAKSLALAAQLESDKAYKQVNDDPVTIDQVAAVLKDGEAFFKLARVNSYIFGIVIDRQGSAIYRVDNPAIEVDRIIELVRTSIDRTEENKVPIFQVAGAYALWKILAGPVADRLTAAKSLTVDASGVLDKLPIGVLVTDEASVKNFAAIRGTTPYDYRAVDFLAKRLPVAMALSPRSLLVSRSLAASTAQYPFIGFAQHMPVQVSAQAGQAVVSVGSGCTAELAQIALLSRQLQPINARELREASTALGVPNAPEVTGAAFTDTAIRERTDLNQFQVLHFATHGLTEGQWACAKAPPALVTSLGKDGSDAILSFDEVAQLKLDANLVVLSACDTSAGVSIGGARATGEEDVDASLDGLVRAFLAAQARAVLSTYWPISDAGESEALITDFYAAARDGSIQSALQTAQVKLMSAEGSSHPIYWGAFFLVGDGQRSLLSGPARTAAQGKAPPTKVAAR
jgi:CHAT domain-containing protein